VIQDEEKESFYDDILYFNDKSYLDLVIDTNLESDDFVDKNILDFGSGSGEVSAILAKKGARSVLALDIGKKNISHGRTTYATLNNLTFERQDLNLYVLAEDSFDLIWSDTVVELLRRPFDEMADEFFRSLRHGGILYVSLTEKTLFTSLLYTTLRIINKKISRSLIRVLKFIAALKIQIFRDDFDKKNFEEKTKYFFIPYIQLISRERATQVLERAGFQIEYIRDRIKSDLNSTAHFEIRAKKC
jgi:2-polyprenyl-3-methyl-5-hydroxy-6-metoxy-1,4-benzoquinol methylase